MTSPDAGPARTVRRSSARSARALLPADDRAPVAARRLASTLLLAWGHVDQVEMVELIIGELVTNAVVHAGDFGDLELELDADSDCIRLSVADGSTESPVLRNTIGDGGLGLRLVETVAAQWGVDEYVLGKRVWVELPARPAQ